MKLANEGDVSIEEKCRLLITEGERIQQEILSFGKKSENLDLDDQAVLQTESEKISNDLRILNRRLANVHDLMNLEDILHAFNHIFAVGQSLHYLIC
ncbi:MAG: hypothetical protein WCV73_03760 [Patescibacteria group bacterium]